jgi:hypothetical protein
MTVTELIVIKIGEWFKQIVNFCVNIRWGTQTFNICILKEKFQF